MSDDVCNHAVVRQLRALYLKLEQYLKLSIAKGYMCEAETVELRNALFKLNADYQKVRWPLANPPTHAQSLGLQQAMQAAGSAAVCLLSGRHDCPAYVSVDVRRLTACLALMRQGMSVALIDLDSLVTDA